MWRPWVTSVSQRKKEEEKTRGEGNRRKETKSRFPRTLLSILLRSTHEKRMPWHYQPTWARHTEMLSILGGDILVDRKGSLELTGTERERRGWWFRLSFVGSLPLSKPPGPYPCRLRYISFLITLELQITGVCYTDKETEAQRRPCSQAMETKCCDVTGTDLPSTCQNKL